jgi:hypothetical protein
LTVSNQTSTSPIRCNHCAHYYITHDINFRYGCHALGFKSQKLPMRVVEESSGQPCQYFEKKR